MCTMIFLPANASDAISLCLTRCLDAAARKHKVGQNRFYGPCSSDLREGFALDLPCSPKPTHCSGTASVLSALDRGCLQKWHSNKVLAPPTRLGRSTNTSAASGSPQQRAIARTTHKSGEYRRIRGRTYCPGATIMASIWGVPIDVSRIDCMSGAVQARAQT